MHLNDFERNTKTILTWFNKKLTDAQAEIMYNQLRGIPSEAYRDIIEELISGSKFFPTIDDIKSRWWKWKDAHPEKIVTRKKTPCNDCMGDGLLYIAAHMKTPGDKPYRNQPYHQVVRCGSCDNWLDHFADDGPVPIYRRSELEARGFEVEPDLEKVKRTKPNFEHPDKTAARIGHDVREYDYDGKMNRKLQKLKKQARQLQQQEL